MEVGNILFLYLFSDLCSYVASISAAQLVSQKAGICDVDTFWIATWTICSSIKHVYHLIFYHGLLTQRYGRNECKCIEDTL